MNRTILAVLALALAVPGVASAQSIGTPTASSYQPALPGQPQAAAQQHKTEWSLLGGLLVRNFTYPEQDGTSVDFRWAEEDSATTAFVASIEGDIWMFQVGKGTTTYTSYAGEADRGYTMLGFGVKMGYTPFVRNPRSNFEVGVIWSQLTDQLWFSSENGMSDLIDSIAVTLPTLRMKAGAFVADVRVGELALDLQTFEGEERAAFSFVPAVMLRAGARF